MAGRVGGDIGSGGSVGVCSVVSLDACVTSDPVNRDGVDVGGAVY